MTVVNNFGNRNMPSVHYGRANIWNRYNAHAQMKRDQSVFNSCHCGYGAAPPMFGGFGFGARNTNIEIGPSKSYVVGNVLGQIGGLVKNNWASISNWVGKIFHKAG